MSTIRASALAASLVVLGASSALLPRALDAQSAQRMSVQASGLHVSTGGDAYAGMQAGPGAEAQLRYTPGAWSFGLGGQLSTHAFDDDQLGEESVRLAGVFLEPRRVIDIGRSFAPYASARLAFLRQSLDIDVEGETVRASASGTQANVGGGVLLRVSPRLNVDLGATFGVISFGDVKVSVPGYGTFNAGSTGRGQNLVVRAGIALGM